MSFQCGIVGLPNVGKSTAFSVLTQIANIGIANYPFCTIEPNRAQVPVPDARLQQLNTLLQPKKCLATTVEFVDIAGLVAGASQGEGMGNQFLSHIREVDALIHVVRCFEDTDVVHINAQVDPIKDIQTIETELILADLETVDRALQRHQRRGKLGDKKAQEKSITFLEQVRKQLDKGLPLRNVTWEIDAREHLKTWRFLTLKPMLYLANVDEQGFTKHSRLDAVREQVQSTEVIPICAKLEAAFIQSSEIEKHDFLSLLGVEVPSLQRLIQAAYTLLGLRTFFTAGEQEVCARTIPIGASAWDAAGCIHTDFQKAFIRAEVTAFNDFMTHGGEQGAKAAGKWRLEGKDYLVQEGDILYFRVGRV